MDLSGTSDTSGDDGYDSSHRAKRPRRDNYRAFSTHSDRSGDDGLNYSDTHNKDDGDDIRKSGARFSYAETEQEERSGFSDSSPKGSNNKETDSDEEESFMSRSYRHANSQFYNNDNLNEGENSKLHGVIKETYSEKAQQMMAKMGYQVGKGLGKAECGRAEPVEASTQKGGRAGFGMKPSTVGELPQDFKWTHDNIETLAEEKVCWIPSSPSEPLTGDQLEEWLQRGPKKLTINDETEFVKPHILKGVLDAKTIFDSLNDNDLRNARSRSNPYETIGAVIFLNRAAVKMANLDAVFDYMFTNPKKQNSDESAVDNREILYFADVCAGPGGFSEYVLYRKGWRAKGFGFTLKDTNDFKLLDFYAGTPETFNPFYGIKDDGNIFDPENLTSLKEYVLKQTDDKGVHFLMADGGFSVEGQENIQEILSKQLYLCQCVAALMLVRTGGHFVVKLFDVFTLFSVGLVYIMYRCFEQVSIHKPVTSRPANSERYLVCKWKRAGTEPVERHLFYVNELLNRASAPDSDVIQLVPLSVIQDDKHFFHYIYSSNCVLGEAQIKNLVKLSAFSKDKDLKESTQIQIREQCLKLWKLPDECRKQPERLNPDDTLSRILSLMKRKPPDSHPLHTFKTAVLNKSPHYLEKSSDLNLFKTIYEWHMVFLSSAKNSPDLKFFIGCGGKQVYQLDGVTWRNVVDLHLSLPAKTLIYGEVIKEYQDESSKQMHSKAFHIIDAVMLGGVDISHLPLKERINQCTLFCDALSKIKSESLSIRCKRLYSMEHFQGAMNNLEYHCMKRVKKAITIDVPHRAIGTVRSFYTIGSVLFIKEIKEPWMAVYSKSTGYKYYFNTADGKSKYHIVPEAIVDMLSAFTSRILWPWEPEANAIYEGQSRTGLNRPYMDEFIAHKIAK